MVLSHLLFTNLGRLTHICVDNLTITGSDNGLAPTRRQYVITDSRYSQHGYVIIFIIRYGTKLLIHSQNSMSALLFKVWESVNNYIPHFNGYDAGILLTGLLGTHFSEISIESQESAFGSVVYEMTAMLSRPQYINIKISRYFMISRSTS